jgi:hypothetical protein
MPKMTVEGLHDADGQQGFPALDSGWYKVEINQVEEEERENQKGTMTRINFVTTVLEGPEQERDGSDPNGQKIFHSIYLLHPDHSGYEKGRFLGVNQFKAVCNAAGVKVTSGDNVNLDDFVGKEVLFRVGKREFDGEEVNEVKKVKAVD